MAKNPDITLKVKGILAPSNPRALFAAVLDQDNNISTVQAGRAATSDIIKLALALHRMSTDMIKGIPEDEFPFKKQLGVNAEDKP